MFKWPWALLKRSIWTADVVRLESPSEKLRREEAKMIVDKEFLSFGMEVIDR